MKKLIYGFGINDADYAIYSTVDGKQVACPFYVKWMSMIERCYSAKCHAKHPTYIGCKVCEEWRSFMAFRKWMIKHDWQGKQLDKDLCGDGKLYSPGTCVFVTQAVNNFTTDRGAARGECSIGVTKHRGRFQALVSMNGKLKHLGRFDTDKEAHGAWRTAKRELGIKLIEQQTCLKTAIGLWNYLKAI